MGASRRSSGDGLEAIARRVMAREGPVRLTGLRGAARVVAAAELVRAHGARPVLILCSSAKAGDSLLEELRACLGEHPGSRRLRALPRHDTLPYDRFSPQPFVVTQRMEVLHRWLAWQGQGHRGEAAREPAPIVIAPWTALALRVPARSAVAARTVELTVGQSLDRDALVEALLEVGHVRMPLVEEPGELAVRGGIVDLFPPHARHPLRIEFFGDEIESIRDFDAASQRSQEKLAHVVVPPPRELLISRAGVIERAPAIRALAAEQSIAASDVDALIDSLLRGSIPPGGEVLAPLLQPDQESVLDYLPADALVLLDDADAGRARLQHYFEEARHNREAALDAGRLAPAVEALLVLPEEIEAETSRRRSVALERLDVLDLEAAAERISVLSTSHDGLRRALAASRSHERALAPLVEELSEWLRERWRVVLTVASLSAAERLKDLLSQYGLACRTVAEPRAVWHWSLPGRIEIRVVPLGEGFSLPAERLAVVSEEEIFGHRERPRRRGSWKEATALEGLSQLAPGDYLVHAEHGIGVYRGLVELSASGVASDLLCIEYEAGDRLFLPVHRLNLVQRYGASEGAAPRIDRLGGETWQRARSRVKKSLLNMARELLTLHAARELAPGFGFSPRDAYFEEFEATFGYEETPDQLAAIEEVLADMQKSQPMDRLVCGDVGYGKTEVAIRAAFRAAMDGKQVVVMVPTTVLCQQHYETFEKRFDGHPIRVEMLSRFCSPARSREVIDGLASGKVDIVVATHRILQKKVRFHDLGLLVIDEEQRFGVAHKERIKRLRQAVDVVTLTATPIPRTLQMAFTGIRDLSVIETPPADRLAVRTQVCRESESLVREAILREMRRGGQIFFVHNRVKDIGAIAEMLARVVPEAKVIVAHGQMRERALEDRMHAFMRGEAEVLLCTTIIESGLDIPRANTILIQRADTFGLAQLYQLRGRVGRSHHRAYAYLMVPTGVEHLPDDAQRRLEAIQDLSELGSGFRLASMDLEIRGAGDLLGSEQSGNLRAVGYETYMEMLEATIEELRGTVHEEFIDPEIRLPVVARLPDAFVPEVSQRLVLYKRLSSARDEHDVERIRDELLDRYGPLPTEAESLLEVIRLKILARRLGIDSVSLARGEICLSVAATSRIDPQRLVRLLSHARSGLRVTPDHKIYGRAPGLEGGPAALFDGVRVVLKRLGSG